MQTEEWKELVWHGQNLGEYYKVSSTGKVVNLRTGKIMKSSYVGTKGYKGVTVHVPALGIVNQKPRLHVVVAESFLGEKPFPKAQVNHKDGNKENNNASNLEWTTPKGNWKHAQEMGLVHKNSKCKPVYRIKKDGNGNVIEKKWFPSMYEAAEQTWKDKDVVVTRNSIRKCLKNGPNSKTRGYYWILAN